MLEEYWVAATLLMAAVLYLHYYGLYLLAATVIAGSLAAVRNRLRERLRATITYGLACLAAFAPWAPQFFYQLYNTGAPWAPHPSVLDLFGDSFNALASAAWAAILVAIGIALLSARRATAALRTRLGSVPGPSASPAPSALAPSVLAPSALALSTAIPVLTVVLAWSVGQLSTGGSRATWGSPWCRP